MSSIHSSFKPPVFDRESNGGLLRKTGLFHEDLLLQILLRLPINSLLRFRCVSRSWYSLLTSSEFISSHVRYNKENNNDCVLLRIFDYDENKKVWYKLCKDNETLDELMIIDFPFVSQSDDNDFFRMVGCMNGLVCLSDDVITKTDTLMLWNPVIRRFLPLPSLNMDIDRSSLGPSVFGFGYDYLHNDYKVIKIQYHSKNKVLGTFNKASIAVFRLNTGFWEDRGINPLPFIDSRQAYVHGTIHWVADNQFVMGFDVSNEDFKSLTFPKPLQDSHVRDLTIAPWCDSLSIFDNERRLGRISLWVMKAYGVEESWVKQFVIESNSVVRCLRRNGDVILQKNDRKLVLYNSKTNKFEDFDTHTEGSSSRGFHMKSFTESLVLLDRKDAKLVPLETQ